MKERQREIWDGDAEKTDISNEKQQETEEKVIKTDYMTTLRTKQEDKVQGMQRGRRKGKGSRV